MNSRVSITALVLILATFTALHGQLMVEGSLTHEKEAAAGETYGGSIAVRNMDNKDHAARVYQTDYFFYADGRSLYGEVGSVERSNATWLDFFPKRFTIPAGDAVVVNYTVAVPNQFSLVGTYWSMLMVEAIPEDSPEVAEGEDNEVTIGLRESFRFGVQMVTHIGDTGSRQLKIIGAKLLKTEAGQALQLDVTNTGERWQRPIVQMELYDLEGSNTGSYEGDRLRIYPGTSARFTVNFSNVSPGTYKALVVLDSGGDDVYGANYTLRITE